MKIFNPATETLLREVSEDTTTSIQEKFARAKKAQPAWARVPLQEKLSVMRKFRDSLVRDKERLAQILTSEVGKPISQSRNEVGGVLGRIDFFLENTEKALAPQNVFSDKAQNLEEKITFEPLGVIANISAWNYPYFVGSNVFVPALLTGNAVLYKPSEFATLTGIEIGKLLHEAGIPDSVFSVVIGTGSVGSDLLKLPLQGAFFTGSYGTGAKVAEAAAKQLMKTQLELGGKDPAYVCEDVDVAQAAAALADGAFYNNGQSCCSVERIYVHARIHDAFVDAFVKEVKSWTIGDPTDEKTYISALTRKVQIDFLEDQVRDAQDKGAKLLCGGKRMKRAGAYFEPTVFTHVNHSMKLMRDESFGPIIGIQKVESDEEAVTLMNDTEFGLTSGIYTRDRERALRIGERLNSGSMYWNCCDRVSPRLPWSGRKHSGIGSTLSILGIQTFVQPKAWHLKTPAS